MVGIIRSEVIFLNPHSFCAWDRYPPRVGGVGWGKGDRCTGKISRGGPCEDPWRLHAVLIVAQVLSSPARAGHRKLSLRGSVIPWKMLGPNVGGIKCMFACTGTIPMPPPVLIWIRVLATCSFGSWGTESTNGTERKTTKEGSTSRMNEDAGNHLCNILTIKAPKVVICQAAGPWMLLNISQYKHVCQVRGNWSLTSRLLRRGAI